MGFLERLVSQGRLPKVVNGQHPERTRTQTDESATKPDLLPLPEDEVTQAAHPRHNVLVGLTGTELDREMVTMAGTIALSKHVDLFAVYGIQVPRTLPVDAEMPEETHHAGAALDLATSVAEQLGVHLEPEIVQSRHFGQSLVEEGAAHDCALLVLGLPYQLGRTGHFDLNETVDYVLKNAPCKVWLVRGRREEMAQPNGSGAHEQPERQKVIV